MWIQSLGKYKYFLVLPAILSEILYLLAGIEGDGDKCLQIVSAFWRFALRHINRVMMRHSGIFIRYCLKGRTIVWSAVVIKKGNKISLLHFGWRCLYSVLCQTRPTYSATGRILPFFKTRLSWKKGTRSSNSIVRYSVAVLGGASACSLTNANMGRKVTNGSIMDEGHKLLFDF